MIKVNVSHGGGIRFFLLNSFLEGDMLLKMAKMDKIAQRLPDGFVSPLTTQKYDFRDPSTLTESGLDRPSLIKPADNIVPDGKLPIFNSDTVVEIHIVRFLPFRKNGSDNEFKKKR